MNEPKYQLGERIKGTPFIVRGITNLSQGNTRYFVQILNSDNTLVGTEDDIAHAIAIIESRVKEHYARHLN